MKFCPVHVVPEICPWTRSCRKERKENTIRVIIIIIRNGAKTISLQTTFGRLNNITNIFNVVKITSLTYLMH